MKKFSALYIVALIYTALLLQSQAYSQDTTKAEQAVFARHHAGWAFSYAAGNATTGREAMMISTMYSYTLEDWCDLEASIHYVGRSWQGEFIGPVRLHTTSWTFDVTPMIRLSNEGFLRPFRVGLGISVHSLKYLSNPKDLFDPTLEFSSFDNLTFVGGTFKLEYNVPISRRIDIGIRGQMNLYPSEFQGVRQDRPSNFVFGTAGIGIFARFNW